MAVGADQDIGSQPAAKTLQKQLSEDFLALSGRSSRTRTVIAAVIYLVAFAGTTFLQLRYLRF